MMRRNPRPAAPRRPRWPAAAALAMGATVLLAAAPPAAAVVVYYVDRFDDGNAGACHVLVAGDCTLRRAVQLANGDDDDSVIRLPDGHYELTVAGELEDGAAAGDLDLIGVVTIEPLAGAAPTIEQTTDDRIFDILNFASDVTLQGPMTLLGGDTSLLGASDARGGAIRIHAGGSVAMRQLTVVGGRAGANGGCVHVTNAVPSWTVTLEEVVLRGCEAEAGGGLGSLAFDGILALIASTVEGNLGEYAGGGLDLAGSLDVHVVDSVIRGNSASSGGGLAIRGASVDLERSAVVFNLASGSEGGAAGGGIHVGHGSLELENTTLSGNLSNGPSPRGSQLVVAGNTGNGQASAELFHATVVGDGGAAAPSTVAAGTHTTVSFANSVVVGECEPGACSPSCPFASAAQNVHQTSAAASSCGFSPAQGDVITTDAALVGAAAVFGGPFGVLTQPPTAQSPTGFLGFASCAGLDARQAPRTAFFCHAGAHERSCDTDPGCTVPGPWIFADGFEAGNAAAWGG